MAQTHRDDVLNCRHRGCTANLVDLPKENSTPFIVIKSRAHTGILVRASLAFHSYLTIGIVYNLAVHAPQHEVVPLGENHVASQS